MEILRLSHLIGDEIAEIRCQYTWENEYGLQEFHSYIRLKSGHIIDIPDFPEYVYRSAPPGNLNHDQSQFYSGTAFDEPVNRLVVGQKIVDFHFNYYENELDWSSKPYIELSNGMYLTEDRSAPLGASVGLFVLTKERFADRTSGQDVRSFLAMRKTEAGE
jgi:hypothetical protein